MPFADQLTEAAHWIDEALATATGPECVTSSFQAECVALVHMLISRRPDIPVLFLDTGYHFPETYAYRDEIAAKWNLNLVNLLPKLTVPEQESQFGILYQSAPDRCCGMRKVEPLFSALEGYETWFTALRREQSKTRASLEPIADFKLTSGKHLRKVSPLADWTTRDVWAYLKENRIRLLPLYEKGFTSIGCAPCTSLPADPNDPRSGRWAGKKLECGIHIQASQT
ncbi:MAG TPA: phosphoadenylyl-sulfate reductase [Bryobacteraceae bacterium]|nr:phosphoadenylyl-sulfate reductase [Bryobacteraceae bacterium]